MYRIEAGTPCTYLAGCSPLPRLVLQRQHLLWCTRHRLDAIYTLKTSTEVTTTIMTSGQRPTAPGRGNTTKSDHTPAQPSSLRRSYTSRSDSPPLSPGSSPRPTNDESVTSLSLAGPSQPHRNPGTETTPLLRSVVDLREHVHDGPCNHGTFSPRPLSPTSDRSYTPSITDTDSDIGNVPIIDGLMNKISGKRNWRRKWVQRIKSKKMSTSSALAERHGIKDDALM